MPSITINQNILVDERINKLTDFEFRLWITLLLLADRDGVGDARIDVINGYGFPLCRPATKSRIRSGLQALIQKGEISISGQGEEAKYKVLRFELLFPENGRKTKKYGEWRKSVFERDNYTCRLCGKRGGKLNAHHLKRYRNNIEGRTDISNGITLCEECHRQLHKREGK